MINRILITSQQKNSDGTSLNACVNLPLDLSEEMIDDIVEEFRSKVTQYANKNTSKTFSNITPPVLTQNQNFKVSQGVFSSIKSIKHQEEVSVMKVDQIIETLRFMRLLEDKVKLQGQDGQMTYDKKTFFKNTNISITIDHNTINIFKPNQQLNIFKPDQEIINLNCQGFIDQAYDILKISSSKEEFYKRILLAWDDLSF